MARKSQNSLKRIFHCNPREQFMNNYKLFLQDKNVDDSKITAASAAAHFKTLSPEMKNSLCPKIFLDENMWRTDQQKQYMNGAIWFHFKAHVPYSLKFSNKTDEAIKKRNDLLNLVMSQNIIKPIDYYSKIDLTKFGSLKNPDSDSSQSSSSSSSSTPQSRKRKRATSKTRRARKRKYAQRVISPN